MGKMVLKSYAEINADRKRLRIIFILVSLPFLIVISLFGFKAYTMYTTANAAITHFEDGNFKESKNEAEKLKVTNFIEEWLAYYNSGTASAAQEKYPKAISDLEHALTLIQGTLPKECFVRANLALSYEGQGDVLAEQGNTTEADKFYWSASQIAESTPEACFPPSEGGTAAEGSDEGKAGTEIKESGERSDEKNSQNETDPSEGENPTEEPKEGQEESDRETIQEQMNESDADRRENEKHEEGKENNNGGASKPW